jgi:hypothetical protein
MSEYRHELIAAARKAGVKKIETPDHPCKPCGGTVFYAMTVSGQCVNCKNKRRNKTQ